MIIISPKYKYIYIINPKVASTSIRNLLHELNGFPALEDPNKVMSHKISGFTLPEHLGPDKTVKKLQSPEYYRFSFSRNPFKRLVSGFVYFKERLEKEACNKRKKRKRVLRRSCDPRGDIRRKMKLNFTDFVEAVCLDREQVLDQHWRPQVEVLRTDLVEYDFIGKIESYAKDMAFVLHTLNAPPDLIEKAGRKTNSSGKSKSAREWYKGKTADMVRERFAEDFDQFGYSYDLPK